MESTFPRLMGLFVALVMLLVFFIGRIVYININSKYAQNALALRSYVSSELAYKRGDILDRNGNLLATSETQYNLIVDPKVILYSSSYLNPTIDAICRNFDLEKEKVREIIKEKSTSSYVVLLKNLSYDDKASFTKFVESYEDGKYVKGVWFEEDYKRVYLYNNLGSHVIGFTVSRDEGSYGIEQAYNSYLCGTNGRSYGYYDAELNLVETVKPAVDGNNVVSTIDINVQRAMQEVIHKFLDEVGAKNCAAIIMDANSGEIVGMQSNYSYDLNNPRDLSLYYTAEEVEKMNDSQQLNALFGMWRNFCISDAYEPGSVFKPFTISAALEENLVKIDSTWVCDGFETFPGDITIKCNNVKGHGKISLAQAIMLSCNDALMQVAAIEGKTVFSKYQQSFRFGKLTGIDIPGETNGGIFTEDQLNATELATSSFGQGITVTMMQMISGFASLINGGIYYEPHVVKKIVNPDGATVTSFAPKVVTNTVSEETSEFLQEALYLTVTSGTAKKAQIAGYKIGGKTGTAQKLPRDAEKYLVSFMGFAENDTSKYVCYVIVDECFDEEQMSKSSLAQKLFVEIMDRVLPILKIYPEGEINYHIDLIKKDQIDMDPENTQYDPEGDEGNINVIPEN